VSFLLVLGESKVLDYTPFEAAVSSDLINAKNPCSRLYWGLQTTAIV